MPHFSVGDVVGYMPPDSDNYRLGTVMYAMVGDEGIVYIVGDCETLKMCRLVSHDVISENEYLDILAAEKADKDQMGDRWV